VENCPIPVFGFKPGLGLFQTGRCLKNIKKRLKNVYKTFKKRLKNGPLFKKQSSLQRAGL